MSVPTSPDMAELRIEERIAATRMDLSPQERKAAATLLEHLDDLAQLETLDQGKSLRTSRFGEVPAAINQFNESMSINVNSQLNE